MVNLGTGGIHAQDKPGFGGTAAISGIVTFTDGSPVVNRVVEWRPSGDSNGGSTVQTDKSGAYLIQGLKDGEYFVGYFQPNRLPPEKNPNVEAAPDANAPEFDNIGKPLVQRVQIKQGQSVKGIDFVITNIGDERVPGTGTGGSSDGVSSDVRATLPVTGASGDSGDDRRWTAWLVVAAMLAGLIGAVAVAFPLRTRGRR